MLGGRQGIVNGTIVTGLCLGSPLFGFARTQTHSFTVYAVADEGLVHPSRHMPAAIAIQNVAYYLQQSESVALYTVGTARVIRCHGRRREQLSLPFLREVIWRAVYSEPRRLQASKVGIRRLAKLYAALAKCPFTLWRIVAGICSTRGPLSFFALTLIAIPPASGKGSDITSNSSP